MRLRSFPWVRQDLVLIVDDEVQIRRAVRRALEGTGHGVVECDGGEEAVELNAAQHPALIILDLGLPDVPGIEVCRRLRAQGAGAILVLSARHDDAEKVALLDAGADDYVTKPFSTVELQARVRALLRRARRDDPTETTLVLGNVTLDFAKPLATLGGETVHLTKTEWALVRTLAAHLGRTLTHKQLWTAVWGYAHGDAAQHLRVHVRALRRKLEADAVRPALLVTEPGVGYRLEKPS